jgi:putative membrane protein
MRRFLMIVGVALSVAWMGNTTVLAQNATKSAQAHSVLKDMDRQFAMKAAMGGMMEVNMGRIATKQAASASVRQFGQRMVTDHGKANAELKQLATRKNIRLPKSLDAEKKQMVTHVSKLSGASFDKAYMSHMVKDHEKDVAEFEKAASECQDPDLKAWAQKTLPTLRSHLEQARKVAAQVGAVASK